MTNQNVLVDVETHYLKKESRADKNRYVFSYTVTITNNSENVIQLMSRHWIITNGETLKTQEVRGDGVIGQQPQIPPGEHFTYSSGTLMESPVGTMHGSYHLQTEEGDYFHIEIPAFTLAATYKVH